jgi:pimeloyl-ACP methyl ester carboxylesterase
MFQPLLTRLADSYHLVAPDYPGFGHSDWPDPKSFAYTFDPLPRWTIHASLGLSHYTLYMQDYGGPVGFDGPAHRRAQAPIVQGRSLTNWGVARTGNLGGHSGGNRPAHEGVAQKPAAGNHEDGISEAMQD